MAGDKQNTVPVPITDSPDLKKVLDTADKNEAVRELQRQLNSTVRFAKAKQLLVDPALRARMQTFLNDPNLKEKIPESIRANLARIISELENVSAARAGLREEIDAATPPDKPSGQAPTATPTGKPDESTGRQTQPVDPAKVPKTDAAATPAPKPADKSDDKGKLISEMSFTEIFQGLSKNLGGLFALVGQFFGGISSNDKPSTKPAEAKPAAPKFTEEQLRAIRLALEKNKDTQYPGQEKATEYVCDLLNLPRVETPQLLLDYLKNSDIGGQNLVFNRDVTNLKNLKNGDVVFFRKDANHQQPYLSAVVSKVISTPGQEPRIYVKTIGIGGGQPTEMEIAGDFRAQFFGAVQLPQSPNPATPGAPA